MTVGIKRSRTFSVQPVRGTAQDCAELLGGCFNCGQDGERVASWTPAWFELHAKNHQAAVAFYRDVFKVLSEP